MTGRTSAPHYQPITIHSIPEAVKIDFDNGIPCYVMSIGEQEVIRLEFTFPASSWKTPHPLLSYFAVKMMLEGTVRKSFTEINGVLDRYGAFTEIVHTPDYYGIVVFAMPKFLPEILPLIAEILDEASFPESGWQKLLNIAQQQLKVNLEQNSWLAGSKFKAALFGSDSRYGYSHTADDLSNLRREEVVAFYQDNIRQSPFYLFASGKVDEATVGLLQKYLGNRGISGSFRFASEPGPGFGVQTYEPVRIERSESAQMTLRMGKKVPGRSHPDYFKLLVTNEILGGYFGSRLMKNIREEKGLTYGIGSYLPVLKDATYFMIGTDVKKDSQQELLDEIRKEIKILQTEPVPAGELERVKNVMAGEFARSLSNAFEIGDLYQTIVICGLPADFYENYLTGIRSVQAEEIQYIAKTYLDPDSMVGVLVG